MLRNILLIILVLAILGIAACGSAAGSPAQPGATATAPASGAAAGQDTAPAPATTPAAPAQAPAPAASAPAAPAAPAEAQAPTKLNLNTATREQFLTIPGVGDRMVREFLEYRPYQSILQFRREIGKYVSQEQVAAYEQYVFVPVDPNTADAETLRQLPGVDAAVAAQLIAGRPYASAAVFLTKLGQYLSADQVTAASGYLATA